MAENTTSISIDNEGAVRTITLNRTEVLNAFNEEMLQEIDKALADAGADQTVRCIVMTGAGRAFSSGMDLREVRRRIEANDPVRFDQLLRGYFNPVITKIRTIEKPIIGSINGVAAGAGCSMALACDMRIAGKSAAFMQAFINVGLIPDAGSTFMLPRLVGVARAMELAGTGRRVDADEALRIGLVNQVVPDEALPDETRKLARRLAEMPTRAIGLIKRALNAAWSADLETQLDLEAVLQAEASQTADHPEGVFAFLEKRPPRFKGK